MKRALGKLVTDVAEGVVYGRGPSGVIVCDGEWGTEYRSHEQERDCRDTTPDYESGGRNVASLTARLPSWIFLIQDLLKALRPLPLALRAKTGSLHPVRLRRARYRQSVCASTPLS